MVYNSIRRLTTLPRSAELCPDVVGTESIDTHEYVLSSWTVLDNCIEDNARHVKCACWTKNASVQPKVGVSTRESSTHGTVDLNDAVTWRRSTFLDPSVMRINGASGNECNASHWKTTASRSNAKIHVSMLRICDLPLRLRHYFEGCSELGMVINNEDFRSI